MKEENVNKITFTFDDSYIKEAEQRRRLNYMLMPRAYFVIGKDGQIRIVTARRRYVRD